MVDVHHLEAIFMRKHEGPVPTGYSLKEKKNYSQQQKHKRQIKERKKLQHLL
jgi:hypothetical protein